MEREEEERQREREKDRERRERGGGGGACRLEVPQRIWACIMNASCARSKCVDKFT